MSHHLLPPAAQSPAIVQCPHLFTDADLPPSPSPGVRALHLRVVRALPGPPALRRAPRVQGRRGVPGPSLQVIQRRRAGAEAVAAGARAAALPQERLSLLEANTPLTADWQTGFRNKIC